MNNEKALNWLYNKHPDFGWQLIDLSFQDSPGVYCIYDSVNDKAYFGKAKSVKKRLAAHWCDLDGRRHINKLLQLSYSQGNCLFFFCIRHTDSIHVAELLEAHWASVFGPNRVYNVNKVPASDDIFSLPDVKEMAVSLGYKSDFPIYEKRWGCRSGPAIPAIEAARKLIL